MLKTTLWLCAASLVFATIAARVWLFVMEDLALDYCPDFTGHALMPPLSEWLFASRKWLPALSIPWLLAALWLSLKRTLSGKEVGLYAASAGTALVVLVGYVVPISVLPFNEIRCRGEVEHKRTW